MALRTLAAISSVCFARASPSDSDFAIAAFAPVGASAVALECERLAAFAAERKLAVDDGEPTLGDGRPGQRRAVPRLQRTSDRFVVLAAQETPPGRAQQIVVRHCAHARGRVLPRVHPRVQV